LKIIIFYDITNSKRNINSNRSGKSSENIKKTADIESTTESSSAVYEIATARSFTSNYNNKKISFKLININLGK
jgi:hypothetical protein